MNLSKTVFEIAESFMEDAEYVSINDDNIRSLAEEIINSEHTEFYTHKSESIAKSILYELIGCSIDYCFWYGKSYIRPLGSNSTKLYELIVESFTDFQFDEVNSDIVYDDSIKKLCNSLILNRFPLVEERIKHLNELSFKIVEGFIIYLYTSKRKEVDLNKSMELLIQMFPGFAGDIFLKRAALFFIQLYRKFGWYSDILKTCHIPADYHIPKMLNHYGCIEYDTNLISKIYNNELIPKNSLEECEIRSASILVAKDLVNLTGLNVADIDSYLFLKRNECKDPFHLTITTDY